MAGSVVIGERGFPGAGVTTRDVVCISAHSIVDTDATILRDVDGNTAFAAQPAKQLPSRG